MRSQSEEKIRNLTTQLKVEQVKYKKMQFEMTNDTVTAQVDGVVKSVLTEDEAKMNYTPLILLSGGGGYYDTGTMGEFSLGTVSLGQEVAVMSYMSGESAVGTIVEISDQPATPLRSLFPTRPTSRKTNTYRSPMPLPGPATASIWRCPSSAVRAARATSTWRAPTTCWKSGR